METENKNQEKAQTERSVSEAWTRYIYDSLQALEQEERYARNGCKDLIEFCEQQLKDRLSKAQMIQIQYKNIVLMKQDSEILLRKLRNFIPENDYKEIKEKLDKIKIDEEELINKTWNHMTSPPTIMKIHFLPKTNKVIEELGEVRNKLEDVCWPLLRPSIDNQERHQKEAF